MSKKRKGYLLPGIIGAIGGGLIVALATKALPRTMERISGIMEKKMER